MKKLLFILIICVPAMSLAQTKTNKIVMIVSSYGKDMGKTRPGFDMDEFSQAYQIFKANGLVVEVASPKGGKVEPGQFNKDKPYHKIVLQDSSAMKLLNQTKPTSILHAKDYDALYVVGGKGPMFDLVVDPSLQDFILDMDSRQSIISTICHGTIALANIKKDNKYLIENKLITGYSNEEEAMFGKTGSEFPFLLEDRLILRGAKYKKDGAMLPNMLKDGNYITGQNPYSTTLVAEEIIKSLGKTPVNRTKYKDELSMELVKKAVLGDMTLAQAELKNNSLNYDLELIAVYGYYQAMFAKDDIEKIKKGTAIIELVIPYYFNEDLYIPLSEYYLKSGNKTKAIATLNEVLKKNPGSEKASNSLKKLSISIAKPGQ
ncbi:DJ-1/PfpI family protein [Pedobacter steynii]|nr:type 1 glutamine amidotransferase domain-containing protein [Pedobacter steynii]NQX39047.1 DJ-1/PfpI family protein [Pedobacter steynii]